jgi:soluble lytic murein transglycosylase-like protein
MRKIITILITLMPVFSAQLDAKSLAYKYQAPDGSVILSNTLLGLPFKLVERKLHTNYVDFSMDGSVARPMKEDIALRRSNYVSIIEAAVKKHELDAALLHAMIEAESAYQPEAVSHTGAIGLMQLMPGTAARFNVSDSSNPKQNVMGGAEYLKYLLSYYQNNLKLAIAAYNAGEGAVDKYGKTIPPYRETQKYVKHVFSLYRRNLTAETNTQNSMKFSMN